MPQASSEKLCVLAVIETLAPGGAERALLALLTALRDRGHSCRVAVLWPPYSLAGEFRQAGVPVHLLEVSHRWNIPQAVSRLRAVSVRVHPDVIHAHLFFAGVYVAVTRVGDPAPARFVTFHNLAYDSYPARTVPLKARKWLDAMAMRRGMDRRLAVSRPAAEHYAAHLGLGQVSVIPNGLDIDELAAHPRGARAEVRARYGVGGEEPVLLVPGTLRKEKGHRFLLEALARLRSSGHAPRTLLAGAGPLQPTLEEQVRRWGLERHVAFLGHVRHDELLDLMASVDLVVLPSTQEGAGLAAQEAIVLGTVVLASAVGGLTELANREGVRLVAPCDAAALASAIDTALAGGGRRRSEADQRDAAGRFKGDLLVDVRESARLLEEEYRAAISARALA
jgi:glycosyltransferase involved in cell wall biosynthesis